jgi:hypothetical protein
MDERIIETPLSEGHIVEALRDWSSLWGDLLHADMVLHTRNSLPDDASNLFGRRGLWEAAVLAYARTASTGRRRQRVNEIVDSLGRDARACHDEVMAWRNQHAAHRVEPSRETATVRAIIDKHEAVVKRILIRVAPVVGPEDEARGLATRFASHVKTVRDLVWERRIRPLEEQLRAQCQVRVATLAAAAVVPAEGAKTPFAIDINPSGD